MRKAVVPVLILMFLFGGEISFGEFKAVVVEVIKNGKYIVAEDEGGASLGMRLTVFDGKGKKVAYGRVKEIWNEGKNIFIEVKQKFKPIKVGMYVKKYEQFKPVFPPAEIFAETLGSKVDPIKTAWAGMLSAKIMILKVGSRLYRLNLIDTSEYDTLLSGVTNFFADRYSSSMLIVSYSGEGYRITTYHSDELNTIATGIDKVNWIKMFSSFRFGKPVYDGLASLTVNGKTGLYYINVLKDRIVKIYEGFSSLKFIAYNPLIGFAVVVGKLNTSEQAGVNVYSVNLRTWKLIQVIDSVNEDSKIFWNTGDFVPTSGNMLIGVRKLNGVYEIYHLNVSLGVAKRLYGEIDNIDFMMFSPISYTALVSVVRGNTRDLLFVDLFNGNARAIVPSVDICNLVYHRPETDGSLLFVSKEGMGTLMYVSPVGDVRTVFEDVNEITSVDYSSGKFYVLLRDSTGEQKLRIYDPVKRRKKTVVSSVDRVFISSDGYIFAVVRDISGVVKLIKVLPNGKKAVLLRNLDDATDVAFSKDTGDVAFVVKKGRHYKLYYTRLSRKKIYLVSESVDSGTLRGVFSKGEIIFVEEPVELAYTVSVFDVLERKKYRVKVRFSGVGGVDVNEDNSLFYFSARGFSWGWELYAGNLRNAKTSLLLSNIGDFELSGDLIPAWKIFTFERYVAVWFKVADEKYWKFKVFRFF